MAISPLFAIRTLSNTCPLWTYRLGVSGPAFSTCRPTAAGRRLGGQASSAAGRFTNLVRFAQVGSTSTVALELAAGGAPEGLVVVADHQTAGRGRLGRAWEAPVGTSLLCSILLRPGEAALLGSGFLLTACVALAARDAATDLYGVTCMLKWPNDLLVGDQKVAGVLAERTTSSREAAPGIVVGIGCNLRRLDEGAWPAGGTSLEEASGGRLVERDRFLEVLLGALEPRYARLLEGADDLGLKEAPWLVEEVHRASATLGRIVRVELPSGQVLEGQAVALRGDGRLIVAARSGEVVVEAGDVIHLRHGSPAPGAVGGQVP